MGFWGLGFRVYGAEGLKLRACRGSFRRASGPLSGFEGIVAALGVLWGLSDSPLCCWGFRTKPF